MNVRTFFKIILALAVFSFISSRVSATDDKTKIESLISHVEGLKDVKFIRNGSSYDGKDAAKFLRGKWQAKSGEIKTAEDFIAKAASVSSTTGKPYMIRYKDGHEVKCGDYLTEQLKKP